MVWQTCDRTYKQASSFTEEGSISVETLSTLIQKWPNLSTLKTILVPNAHVLTVTNGEQEFVVAALEVVNLAPKAQTAVLWTYVDWSGYDLYRTVRLISLQTIQFIPAEIRSYTSIYSGHDGL